jgi:hypothetical protein
LYSRGTHGVLTEYSAGYSWGALLVLTGDSRSALRVLVGCSWYTHGRLLLAVRMEMGRRRGVAERRRERQHRLERVGRRAQPCAREGRTGPGSCRKFPAASISFREVSPKGLDESLAVSTQGLLWRYSTGTVEVHKGYSGGTQRVLRRYSRGTHAPAYAAAVVAGGGGGSTSVGGGGLHQSRKR